MAKKKPDEVTQVKPAVVEAKVEDKVELTLEDKIYIQDSAMVDGKPGRSVEQMAIVLGKPADLIQAFAEELYPELKVQPKKKKSKSLLLGMMTPREGMSIMTGGASEIGDDIAKRSKKNMSKFAKTAIFRPLGEDHE